MYVTTIVCLARAKSSHADGAGITTINGLTAAVSSPRAHRLRLRRAPLGTSSTLGPGGAFLVWRAVTTGCAIHSGTLELPEGGLLLLAGSGAHFHGTTFKGTDSRSSNCSYTCCKPDAWTTAACAVRMIRRSLLGRNLM